MTEDYSYTHKHINTWIEDREWKKLGLVGAKSVGIVRQLLNELLAKDREIESCKAAIRLLLEPVQFYELEENGYKDSIKFANQILENK